MPIPVLAQELAVDHLLALLTGLVEAGRQYLWDHGGDWLGRIIPALLIFYIGQRVARFAVQAIDAAMHRARLDETLAKFLSRVAYVAIVLIVSLAAVRQLGVDTTSFTAVLAASGLAVGLALQGSLANFAAGIMIIVFRPFKLNDFIEAAGTKGIVEEITIFHTLMRTPDNVQLIVPNGSITGGNITNYSTKPTRRIDLVVGCGYADDLRGVRVFLEELVQDDSRILRDPPPVVAVSELADHSVNFVVRPWVRNSDYWDVRFRLVEQIKLGFDQRGFTIPFPQRDVHVYHSGSTNPARDGARAGGDSTDSIPGTPSDADPLDQLIRPRRAAA